MPFTRDAGILLHATSLPGFGGIGSLGDEAYRFVDTLREARIGLWQVLPLGPTGYGDAPYSSLAAFGGNPLLIALEPLIERGLLAATDLLPLASLPDAYVDFGRVVPGKMGVIRRAFGRFPTDAAEADELASFRQESGGWLEDTALYMALKDAHDGAPWIDWEPELREHRPDAIDRARRRLVRDVDFHCFVQWLFFQQWSALKQYANRAGVRIIGDIPIFVAYDSADVWANQRVFQLDRSGKPTVVAGVPPDYFSPTGQLWGNPHYRWDLLEAEGFGWWIERFRTLLQLVDIVRLDHFRGFAAAWQVPYGEETARCGQWVPAPGAALFQAVRDSLGDAPIVAEDLGVITPDVEALRDSFGFPGMKVLQFAFSTDSSDASLPHNLVRNSVVYTGTHDNNTTVGWFSTLSAGARKLAVEYCGSRGFDISWDLIRLAFASVADFAIVPLQDVLRLGTTARMNLPGSAEGNWAWRVSPGSITPEHIAGLRSLARTYGRGAVPDAQPEALP